MIKAAFKHSFIKFNCLMNMDSYHRHMCRVNTLTVCTKYCIISSAPKMYLGVFKPYILIEFLFCKR